MERNNILVFIRASFDEDFNYLISQLRRRYNNIIIDTSLCEFQYFFPAMNNLFLKLVEYDYPRGEIIVFADPGLIVKHETQGYLTSKRNFFRSDSDPNGDKDPFDYVSNKIKDMPYEGIIASDIIRYPRYNIGRRMLNHLNQELIDIKEGIDGLFNNIYQRENEEHRRRVEEEIRRKEELERNGMRF